MIKLDERKKNIIIKISMIILYLIYWAFLFVDMFGSGEKQTAFIFIYILLFLPLTLAMICGFRVFSLFIIILYEAAQLFTGIMYVATSLVNLADANLLFIIAAFINSFFALSLCVTAIQFLRNKPHTMGILILVLGMAHLGLTIASFIIGKGYTLSDICDFGTNVTLIIILTLYFITFPNIELHVFKDEM